MHELVSCGLPLSYPTFWPQEELKDAQRLQASRPAHTVLELGQDVGSEGGSVSVC